MHTASHKKAKLKIMPFQPLCIARGQRALKIAYLNKQQTPKPDAHVPDAVPPFIPQLSSEKQTLLKELVPTPKNGYFQINFLFLAHGNFQIFLAQSLI